MTRDPNSKLALACVTDAIDAESRSEHSARLRRLFDRSMHDRMPISGGYEFVFDVSEIRELAAFVSLERLCCPFLSFRLEVVSGEEEVRLRIQGPPGARRLIEAELLTQREDS